MAAVRGRAGLRRSRGRRRRRRPRGLLRRRREAAAVRHAAVAGGVHARQHLQDVGLRRARAAGASAAGTPIPRPSSSYGSCAMRARGAALSERGRHKCARSQALPAAAQSAGLCRTARAPRAVHMHRTQCRPEGRCAQDAAWTREFLARKTQHGPESLGAQNTPRTRVSCATTGHSAVGSRGRRRGGARAWPASANSDASPRSTPRGSASAAARLSVR